MSLDYFGLVVKSAWLSDKTQWCVCVCVCVCVWGGGVTAIFRLHTHDYVTVSKHSSLVLERKELHDFFSVTRGVNRK